MSSASCATSSVARWRTSSQPGGAGQELDLTAIARAREDHELIAARALERGDIALHGVGVLGGAARDHPAHVVPEPGVVVAQITLRVALGVVAQREVRQRHLARLAVPSMPLPGGGQL